MKWGKATVWVTEILFLSEICYIAHAGWTYPSSTGRHATASSVSLLKLSPG